MPFTKVPTSYVMKNIVQNACKHFYMTRICTERIINIVYVYTKLVPGGDAPLTATVHCLKNDLQLHIFQLSVYCFPII